MESKPSSRRPTIFVFGGTRDRFQSLYHYRSSIREEFASLVQPEAISCVPSSFFPRFGCHIRLGDFPNTTGPERLKDDNVRLPLSWYKGHLRRMAVRWPDIPIEIFSDGTDAELASILCLPNVRRANYGNAVADLIAMTQVKLLICSGSSFSAWAAFLGKMPTIWFPSKIASQLGTIPGMTAIELDKDEPIPALVIT
jgi:hypothetical protein